MTEKELKDLEAAAKAATPGPWQVTGSEDEVETAWTPQEKGAKPRPGVCIDEPMCVVCAGDYSGGCSPANARYIATANPAVILGLIAELRQARHERDWLVNKIRSLNKFLV